MPEKGNEQVTEAEKKDRKRQIESKGEMGRQRACEVGKESFQLCVCVSVRETEAVSLIDTVTA